MILCLQAVAGLWALNGCAGRSGLSGTGGGASGVEVSQKPDVRWERVTERLARAVPADRDGRPVRWRMRVVPGPGLNAETLPGGSLSVTAPLVELARGEGELAAVIAHEMAHVTLRHSRQRVTASVLTLLGSAAAGWAIAEHGGAGAGESVGWSAGCVFTLSAGALIPLRRMQEKEADRESLRILRIAGYDPANALRFWERFAAARAEKGLTGGGVWSAHPPDAERIRLLREALSAGAAGR